MRKIFIGVCGILLYTVAHAGHPPLTLDGGYVVNAYWDGSYAVQTDYSHAKPTGPEVVGYTVYLQLGCKLTRTSDGVVSRAYNPLLGVAGNCDLVNDTECTVDIAKANAQQMWENNADFICWENLKPIWVPERANFYF